MVRMRRFMVVMALLGAPDVLADRADRPHDGSLALPDGLSGLRNGRLDEPYAITMLYRGCVGDSEGIPFVESYCTCLIEYLRTTTKANVYAVVEAAETGDTTVGEKLLTIPRCKKWALDGGRGRAPFLRKDMMPVADVVRHYEQCRTHVAKVGLTDIESIIVCSRVVATMPQSASR